MAARMAFFGAFVAFVSFHVPLALAQVELSGLAIFRQEMREYASKPHVVAVAISPDGRFLASIARVAEVHRTSGKVEEGDDIVVLWDCATGERLHELRVPHAPARSVCFSPDSRQLAVVYGEKEGKTGIALFDTANGSLQANLHEGMPRFMFVQYSSDGKSLFASGDGLFHTANAKIDLETHRQAAEWKPLTKPSEWLKDLEYVHQMFPSPDGKYIAILIDVAPDLEDFYKKYEDDPTRRPHIMPHFPSPTVLIMVDAATNEPLYRKEFSRGVLHSFTFSSAGERFLVSDEIVAFYDTATGKKLLTKNIRGSERLAESPRGDWLLTASFHFQVKLWKKGDTLAHELRPGQESSDFIFFLYAGNSDWNLSQRFSEDGKLVVISTKDRLQVFDTETGKERLSFEHR